MELKRIAAGVLAAGDAAASFDTQTGTQTATLTFSQIDEDQALYAGDYTGTLTFDIAVES